MVPSRLVNKEAARAQFGDRVDRLAELFLQPDPLADAATAHLATSTRAQKGEWMRQLFSPRTSAALPEPLRDLSEQVHRLPIWCDLDRAERGGTAMLRRGPLGAYVLGLGSLVRSYCSPAGNKVLVATGQLERYALRRALETGRFIQHVCLPGGMRRGKMGFATALHVRLMHAQVRRNLLSSGTWPTREYGIPINQVDMATTLLLFSNFVVDGLERLGAGLTDEEAEDLIHLWRYVGYLMGIREELLCGSRAEARTLWALYDATQEEPDEDSARLARALIERGFMALQAPVYRELHRLGPLPYYAISRVLIGDELADELGFPESEWDHAVPLLRHLLRPATGLLRRVPGINWVTAQAGAFYWNWTLDQALGPTRGGHGFAGSATS